MKRSEILANREKWINYLLEPNRRKIIGKLDAGGGRRCCLGHACYVLDIDRKNDEGQFVYGEDREESLAPDELVDLVGLWANGGDTKHYMNKFTINENEYTSLATANDGKELYIDGEIKKIYGETPQAIGTYLRSAIEGGVNTPFKPLSSYKE